MILSMADYAYRVSQSLETGGFLPSQPWQNRSSISVSENGKIYRAYINQVCISAVYQIDGNVIKTGQKCDKFLVALNHTVEPVKGTAVFIELKGKDISHAIDQLESTIKNKNFTPFPQISDKARARIITAGCGPKSSSKSKLEEARIRFKRQYNIELRVLKSNQTDVAINPE